MTMIHDAPNKLNIQSIWMVISVDEHGNEGVAAAPLTHGLLSVPLIAADEARLGEITKWGEEMAKMFPHKTFKLIRLHGREELKTLGKVHH
jgi:hypothetical protein